MQSCHLQGKLCAVVGPVGCGKVCNSRVLKSVSSLFALLPVSNSLDASADALVLLIIETMCLFRNLCVFFSLHC